MALAMSWLMLAAGAFGTTNGSHIYLSSTLEEKTHCRKQNP
jgi:hypothetical protein